MFEQRKKQTVFIHSDTFHTKIKLPDWLGKALFWQLLAKNPPTVKEKKVGCRNFNCAPLSKPFTDQNKTNPKNKECGTARLCRSIS